MNLFMSKKFDAKSKRFLILKVFLVSSLLFPSVAFAYVDPGSGSVIVTTILGLFAAVGYTLRKYLYKFKRMIGRKKSEHDQQDSE